MVQLTDIGQLIFFCSSVLVIFHGGSEILGVHEQIFFAIRTNELYAVKGCTGSLSAIHIFLLLLGLTFDDIKMP